MYAPNIPGKSFDLNKIRKMPFCPEKRGAPNHLGKLAQMVFNPHPASPYLDNVQIDGPHFINEASLVIAAEYFILVLLCDLVSVVDWVGRGGGNPA